MLKNPNSTEKSSHALVKWGIRRERQRVLFLAAQREMFQSMNHLAMDAGY